MQQGTTLPGDILLVTAFISYVGCFTKSFRQDLLLKMWLPHIRGLEPPIPINDAVDPLKLLTDEATIAHCNTTYLPHPKKIQ